MENGILSSIEYLVQHVDYNIIDNEKLETKEDIIRWLKRNILDVYCK